MKDSLKNIIKNLPNLPGVYQFFDKDRNIIYIGKAKNLKKRVSSYFTKTHDDSPKTRILVRKITDIKHIIVKNENDALLLENNLIKKYKPRYNVLLKDDKTYPWICIKNENFPRVFQTRNVVKDGSLYFGPYTSVMTVRTILDLLHKIYKLRTCKLNLTNENIKQGKFKVCLEYHINNCLAPCVAKQTSEDYNEKIEQIKNILKGNVGSVIKYLTQQMQEYAQNLEFEKAQDLKEKIERLKQYQSKSTVVNVNINDVDVFTVSDDEKYAYVNYMRIINGAVIQSFTSEVKKKLDEEKQDILLQSIVEIRQRFNSTAKEIIVPFELDFEIEGAKINVPKIGDKKKLLDLSQRNVMYFHKDRKKHYENLDPMKNVQRKLEQVKKDLHLTELPYHIEGFDNSNIQGTNPVASCVVFKNAKPSKKDYRHFKIKTVEGPNDFASMEEIIFRRYSRLLNENKELPQLIVIDGGKGQLSAAVSSLKKLNLYGKIAIIGIAKKLEEIYFPNDQYPILLNKNSETLKLIQHIRNESHRFGITFHRQLRSKNFIKTQLDEIKGIGDKTKQKLLKKYKTIENIKDADFEDISALIGKQKAKILFEYFREKN